MEKAHDEEGIVVVTNAKPKEPPTNSKGRDCLRQCET
jgi:hypothetical protein